MLNGNKDIFLWHTATFLTFIRTRSDYVALAGPGLLVLLLYSLSRAGITDATLGLYIFKADKISDTPLSMAVP